MPIERLKMKNENSIPSIDRSNINVKGRSSNKKRLVSILFALIALLLIIGGASWAFMKAVVREEKIELVESDKNFEAGAKQSITSSSDNFFQAIRKKKEFEDEQLRLQELQKEQAELERQRADRQAWLDELAKRSSANETTQEKPVNPIPEKTIDKETIAPTKTETKQPPPKVVYVESNEPKKPTPYELALDRKNRTGVMLNLDGAIEERRPEPAYDNSFDSPRYSDGTATVSQLGYMDFLLAAGTSVPCAIYTQIISEYEGFVTCRVTQDVYSANGATLLVEKGSLVKGNQRVSLDNGKARVATSWGELVTPYDVRIRLDSLGTGPLGAAGIPAWVDSHFGERFGAAILLSFIDDALAAVADSQNNQTVTYDNSTRNASDMASRVLDSSLNIKPTGYVNPAQRINILVVRDVDMSTVYEYTKR